MTHLESLRRNLDEWNVPYEERRFTDTLAKIDATVITVRTGLHRASGRAVRFYFNHDNGQFIEMGAWDDIHVQLLRGG